MSDPCRWCGRAIPADVYVRHGLFCPYFRCRCGKHFKKASSFADHILNLGRTELNKENVSLVVDETTQHLVIGLIQDNGHSTQHMVALAEFDTLARTVLGDNFPIKGTDFLDNYKHHYANHISDPDSSSITDVIIDLLKDTKYTYRDLMVFVNLIVLETWYNGKNPYTIEDIAAFGRKHDWPFLNFPPQVGRARWDKIREFAHFRDNDVNWSDGVVRAAPTESLDKMVAAFPDWWLSPHEDYWDALFAIAVNYDTYGFVTKIEEIEARINVHKHHRGRQIVRAIAQMKRFNANTARLLLLRLLGKGGVYDFKMDTPNWLKLLHQYDLHVQDWMLTYLYTCILNQYASMSAEIKLDRFFVFLELAFPQSLVGRLIRFLKTTAPKEWDDLPNMPVEMERVMTMCLKCRKVNLPMFVPLHEFVHAVGVRATGKRAGTVRCSSCSLWFKPNHLQYHMVNSHARSVIMAVSTSMSTNLRKTLETEGMPIPRSPTAAAPATTTTAVAAPPPAKSNKKKLKQQPPPKNKPTLAGTEKPTPPPQHQKTPVVAHPLAPSSLAKPSKVDTGPPPVKKPKNSKNLKLKIPDPPAAATTEAAPAPAPPPVPVPVPIPAPTASSPKVVENGGGGGGGDDEEDIAHFVREVAGMTALGEKMATDPLVLLDDTAYRQYSTESLQTQLVRLCATIDDDVREYALRGEKDAQLFFDIKLNEAKRDLLKVILGARVSNASKLQRQCDLYGIDLSKQAPIPAPIRDDDDGDDGGGGGDVPYEPGANKLPADDDMLYAIPVTSGHRDNLPVIVPKSAEPAFHPIPSLSDLLRSLSPPQLHLPKPLSPTKEEDEDGNFGQCKLIIPNVMSSSRSPPTLNTPNWVESISQVAVRAFTPLPLPSTYWDELVNLPAVQDIFEHFALRDDDHPLITTRQTDDIVEDVSLAQLDNTGIIMLDDVVHLDDSSRVRPLENVSADLEAVNYVFDKLWKTLRDKYKAHKQALRRLLCSSEVPDVPGYEDVDLTTYRDYSLDLFVKVRDQYLEHKATIRNMKTVGGLSDDSDDEDIFTAARAQNLYAKTTASRAVTVANTKKQSPPPPPPPQPQPQPPDLVDYDGSTEDAADLDFGDDAIDREILTAEAPFRMTVRRPRRRQQHPRPKRRVAQPIVYIDPDPEPDPEPTPPKKPRRVEDFPPVASTSTEAMVIDSSSADEEVGEDAPPSPPPPPPPPLPRTAAATAAAAAKRKALLCSGTDDLSKYNEDNPMDGFWTYKGFAINKKGVIYDYRNHMRRLKLSKSGGKSATIVERLVLADGKEVFNKLTCKDDGTVRVSVIDVIHSDRMPFERFKGYYLDKNKALWRCYGQTSAKIKSGRYAVGALDTQARVLMYDPPDRDWTDCVINGETVRRVITPRQRAMGDGRIMAEMPRRRKEPRFLVKYGGGWADPLCQTETTPTDSPPFRTDPITGAITCHMCVDMGPHPVASDTDKLIHAWDLVEDAFIRLGGSVHIWGILPHPDIETDPRMVYRAVQYLMRRLLLFNAAYVRPPGRNGDTRERVHASAFVMGLSWIINMYAKYGVNDLQIAFRRVPYYFSPASFVFYFNQHLVPLFSGDRRDDDATLDEIMNLYGESSEYEYKDVPGADAFLGGRLPCTAPPRWTHNPAVAPRTLRPSPEENEWHDPAFMKRQGIGSLLMMR